MGHIPLLAFLWMQAQDAAQQPAPNAGNAIFGGNSALLDMLQNSGPVAMAVLALLLLASLHSWSIILGKWSGLRRARTQSDRFVRAFRKASRLQEVAAVSDQFRPSPLVAVFDETYEEYKRQAEITGGQVRSLKGLERATQSASSEALTRMENRMTWLATIGAVSPFIGLFGTIMGIVDAFHGLGTAGGATLRAVAPGISEALITTAAGLAVAVPAVIAYNQFTARIREMGARMDDFARELLNAIEDIQAAIADDSEYARQREAPRGLHR